MKEDGIKRACSRVHRAQSALPSFNDGACEEQTSFGTCDGEWALRFPAFRNAARSTAGGHRVHSKYSPSLAEFGGHVNSRVVVARLADPFRSDVSWQKNRRVADFATLAKRADAKRSFARTRTQSATMHLGISFGTKTGRYARFANESCDGTLDFPLYTKSVGNKREGGKDYFHPRR